MTQHRAATRRRIALGGAAALVGATLVAGAFAGGVGSASAAATPTVTPEQAVADALSALRGTSNKTTVKAASADGYQARSVVIDADGSRHVHLDRTFSGLAVIGGDTIVNSAPNGAFKSATVTQAAPITTSTTPALAKDRALAIAKGAFTGKQSAATATLAVDALDSTPTLVWHVLVSGFTKAGPSKLNVLVDAKTGAVKLKYDSVMAADTGTGNGVLTGATKLGTSKNTAGQFVLKDPTRGNDETRDGTGLLAGNATPSNTKAFTSATNVFGNGKNSNAASAGADVHAGVAATWDFYKTVFKRNGIKNDGKGALAYVHLKDPDTGGFFQNAFWDDSCFCMQYGDWAANKPVTALDVTGHEMTHGVTSATANLIYAGESGGLNEATSDIFGTMVEFYSNNANDPGDYYIGEEIVKDRAALRYMDKPSKDGQSPDCWSSSVANLDVHYSSGIANHFAYLASEGTGPKVIGGLPHDSPTCNASAVQGVGHEAVGKIWYRALTTYFTSGTTYAQARVATLSAATDLYGAASPEHASVAAAWSAVNVN
ncbi:MAG: zinc metalloprotease ZmpA [Cryptosporangiaceae bacterium]|nr:zinc metalloprotease ZmpA [Cryptosporangiaceae bacterium]